MGDFKKNQRIVQLKSMHDLMLNANNENIYMRWATMGVPDCPSDDDFESIALDDEMYNDCFDLFVELIAKHGVRY